MVAGGGLYFSVLCITIIFCMFCNFFLNLFHVLVYIDQFKAIKSLNFFWFLNIIYIYIIIIN